MEQAKNQPIESFVTYAHQQAPDGVRFRQIEGAKLPAWAVNIRKEQREAAIPSLATDIADIKSALKNEKFSDHRDRLARVLDAFEVQQKLIEMLRKHVSDLISCADRDRDMDEIRAARRVLDIQF